MQSIPYGINVTRCFDIRKDVEFMGLAIAGYAVLLSIDCVSRGIKLLND